MIDVQGRIIVQAEQLKNKEVMIYYDAKRKALMLRDHPLDYCMEDCENIYFISTHTMNAIGRISVPKSIRDAFPNATYLPAQRNDEIYILIIEHEWKKTE